MEQINPLPNPPAPPEMPTNPPVNPSSPNKYVLIIVVFLILFGAGGLILGKYLYSPKSPTIVQPVISSVPTKIPTPTPDSTANWETYENKIYKYSLKYPGEWDDSTGDGNIISFGNFTAPQRLSIWVRENNSQLTLEDWITEKEENENWKTIARQIMVGNNQGLELNREQIGIETGEKRSITEVYFIKDNLVYSLIYLKSQGQTFDQILSTFKFLD